MENCKTKNTKIANFVCKICARPVLGALREVYCLRPDRDARGLVQQHVDAGEDLSERSWQLRAKRYSFCDS